MIFSVSFLIIISFGQICADYWATRESIRVHESSKLLGSNIHLTEKEEKVNDILTTIKLKEYNESFSNPSKFLASLHFFKAKNEIEKSPVFKFIQMVPKGGSLHSHFSASLSLDRFFNFTYYDNLYGCFENGTFKLYFFFKSINEKCEGKLLSQWRNTNLQFDAFIKNQLSLVVDDPVATYSNIDKVWSAFEEIFRFSSPLFLYKTLLEDYIYQLLEEFYEDNVFYVELRYNPDPTFDANGVVYNISETMEYLHRTSEKFRENHSDFVGLRFIYCLNRHTNNSTMKQSIEEFLQLQEKYPSLIAGFDLVGQEDKGEPLHKFADQLLEIANRTSFFFHAGETNWYGASSDSNLIDAVLLNSRRIGHGFAIMKHPEVLRIVKEKEIAIEINPISNQVLKLVDDLRNHVGASLIAGGYPVVITCDDPGLWGAKGLSYDWYLAFMAMTPKDGDLKILKQLALNSLIYSSLDEKHKMEALAIFDKRWEVFLDKVLEVHL